MAFLETRISTAVRRGTSGGPVGKREMVYDGAGRLRAQRSLRSVPLHRYRFDFGNKLLEDAEAIRAFFYVVLFTPYEGFRVRDWNDYELTFANSSLTLIAGTVYQINRAYIAGPATFLRPVYKIDPDGSTVIWRDRAGVITVASATVDDDTGQADISGHVGGDVYHCSAYFDVPVTFADDEALADVGLDGNIDAFILALSSIELVELPGPWA